MDNFKTICTIFKLDSGTSGKIIKCKLDLTFEQFFKQEMPDLDVNLKKVKVSDRAINSMSHFFQIEYFDEILINI